jgi:nitrogen fixation NifU-like protein
VKKKEDIENFVEKLQEEIIRDEIEDFNEYIVGLFHNPKNWGKPKHFNISLKKKGIRNDSIEFFAQIKNNIIEKINFLTDGCGATIATANQITLLAQGKPIDYARNLTIEQVNKSLGGLPEEHMDSLELGLNVLKQLINNYQNANIEDVKE